MTPSWLAHGVAASVAPAQVANPAWAISPDEPCEVTLEVSTIASAPSDAESTSRDDLRFVADPAHHALRCFVGPGPQAFSAALQLGCGMATWPRGGMLIHGAGLALDGIGAVAALAVSGGGKSTLSNLADGFLGLSDETLLLWDNDPPRISATPFRSSSHREPQPRSEPLRALLVLEKSLEPSYERLPPHQGMKRLLAQAYQLPDLIAPRAEVFARASSLARSVPTYRFAFPKSPEAALLLRRFFDEELARPSR